MEHSLTIQEPTTSARLNQILQADCLKELASFDENSVDLTVFSPPYDGIRDYKNNWTFDFVELGKHLFRVTKDGGVAVVVIGDGTKNFAKSLTSFRLAVNWVVILAGNSLKASFTSAMATLAHGGIIAFEWTTNIF